jgi:DNA ligase 1
MQYLKLVKVFQELEATTKTLEKTQILADFLRVVPEKDLDAVILLLQGLAFPEYDDRKLGLGIQLAIKAIASSSGVSIDEVKQIWKKTGDLGETAEQVIGTKKQATLFSNSITTAKVIQNLQKLAVLEGAGTVDHKISLLKELLSSAEEGSAKYLIRTCLSDLRIGIGDGTLRDSIAKAFDVSKEAVQRSYNLTTNFSKVAKLAKTGESALNKSKVAVGTPIKVMLYQKATDLANAFERVGKPAAFEYKYDGFMCQIHKKGNKIQLFTRQQEDVTNQFPDVIDIIKAHIKADNFILDSEIIGIDPKTSKWLSFQNISQRIRRKYGIKEATKNTPVMINIFDTIYLNGKTMIHEPFEIRSKELKKVIKSVKNKISAAEQLITSSEKEAKKFYEESLAKGNEGIMAKNLKAEYKPGSRVGYGVKVKPIMETLDLAIVGAEWGTGKRGGWLSSFVLACIDENGNFREMGKMGTGIKEKEEMGVSFQELTRMIKPLIISETGKIVQITPKIVVEVAYEEIQQSPTYNSGFALRFPRLISLRIDRSIKNVNELAKVKRLFDNQRGRN